MLMAVGAVIVVEVGLIAYTLCKQRRYIKSSERKEDLTQTVGEQAYVVFSDWYRLERMQEEEAYILEVLEQKKARYEYYKEHVPAVYEKLRLAGWVK
ncbi:expressed unknown protein [Seminavis robusta]|uniref:Uncharacterized protein n=1 Tax=Seminavis robusta TaxID=568900 RepID=A0A9N8HNG0_9STRA|nr:expressed unknown protein [Seminavis robusta]|eukprot:Sro991_g228710.1 n/a (97) ;mRNA; r:20584-20874